MAWIHACGRRVLRNGVVFAAGTRINNEIGRTRFQLQNARASERCVRFSIGQKFNWLAFYFCIFFFCACKRDILPSAGNYDILETAKNKAHWTRGFRRKKKQQSREKDRFSFYFLNLTQILSRVKNARFIFKLRKTFLGTERTVSCEFKYALRCLYKCLVPPS